MLNGKNRHFDPNQAISSGEYAIRACTDKHTDRFGLAPGSDPQNNTKKVRRKWPNFGHPKRKFWRFRAPGRFVYCRGPGHPAPSCEQFPNFMYARPPCCFSLGLCLVKALGRLLVWPAASLQPVFADRCERWKFDLVSIGTSKASLRLITSNRAKALNRAATCWTLAVLKTKQSSFCLSTPSCSVTV